ncbi:ParB/Srx family N-terminal domain-containing protein [Bradyrhizobium sp.]|uniref:ParB/Srx family N-terminal domain-containing protein n=1 Tax=Bradyrhizobium sp. TaxID=376 RepID=UPI001ED5B573|nr:ParB/Srx family N-terminal domain-containing protein [Bradyrhizobium sp.]MBV9982282.1 ParB N-terminal domain-containing protein [Bradyrhizobium sp.]
MVKQTKPAAGAPAITDEVRKVAELTADPRNARRHSEAQISQIVQAIERFGFVEKLAIRPDGQIIGGHARLEALKRMGRETAECRVIAGLSEAGYKALGLALNRIPENSSWDDDILREIVIEVQDEGEDLLSIGFGPAELKKITTEPDELEVTEIETGPVDDEFWISIRGPLAQQANALKALEQAMKPFAGVTVEQGTISVG